MACPDGLVMIWDPLERFLWGIGIIITLICGIYYINKGRRRAIFNEKIIMFGLASLLFGFAFTLLFTFFQVLQIPVTSSGNIFCGIYPYDDPTHTPLYVLFGRLSYISVGMGGMFFVLTFDIIVKRTKYLLTITFTIFVVMEFFPIPLDLARTIYNYPITLGIVFIVPLVLYLYTKWSRLEFKAVSSFLFFGVILFIISLNLAKRAHKMLNIYPLALSPFFLILGCAITIFPTIINPKVVSRALIYWVIFAILTITLLIAVTIVDIIEGLLPGLSGWRGFITEYVVATIYMSILLYLIIEHIRSEIIPESQETKEMQSKFLGIFTRPEKITEKDVMFHKEQKICLVCKGKLLRSIYLCPECDALYCKKCSRTLTTLENACWACNAAFDPSKPVKPYKEEELEIEVSETAPKKSNIHDTPPEK